MKIDPRRAAFDIDGVIADTMHLFLDIAREVYDVRHIGYGDITSYQLDQCLDMDPAVIEAITDRIIEGNYPCRLAPMQDAGRVLKRLGGFGPLCLVTARPKPGPMDRWLADLLPLGDVRIDLETTGSYEAKADVLKRRDIHYFVEDRLDTCFLLADQDITPVVYKQPWNRQPHPFKEVEGWLELEALFDFDP
ncbi:MAG: haloacid dehalogenase [Desulfosarcinaceae bacterium]